MILSVYRDIVPYITRDGSTIRELMHPDRHGNGAQSLAEATVASGGRTRAHRHRRSEELYYFLRGRGRLHIDGETAAVGAGDTALIPAGSWHHVINDGEEDLVFLCCCSPAYAHADTELQTSSDGGDG